METRVGGLTVRVALLLVMPDREAVILAVPTLTPVARPVAAPTVAAEALLEAHATEVVMMAKEPSE